MSTMYLVLRRAIDPYGGACEDQTGRDTGSRVPLRLFGTKAAADAFAARLCAEARRTMNPFFLIGGWLSNAERERLVGFKLPVDYPDDAWHQDWQTWWELCQDLITDGERAAVWALLAETPPYEVLAVEVDDE